MSLLIALPHCTQSSNAPTAITVLERRNNNWKCINFLPFQLDINGDGTSPTFQKPKWPETHRHVSSLKDRFPKASFVSSKGTNTRLHEQLVPNLLFKQQLGTLHRIHITVFALWMSSQRHNKKVTESKISEHTQNGYWLKDKGKKYTLRNCPQQQASFSCLQNRGWSCSLLPIPEWELCTKVVASAENASF